MEKDIRLLAAVMFTDMIGYTALMQANEQKAKANRDRHREVLEKSVQDAHGQIIQYYGDGTLSVFGSVVEAVRCAVNIQHELTKAPQIPLRIGIHTGDIVYTDDGVYGDAVNIASRIEGKSIAGSVLISDKVNDEIKNHPEFISTSIGVFELKNVKNPIKLYAITNDGLNVPPPNQESCTLKDLNKSVAVLPFMNMSADQENEYFSDGITEEIINALTKIEGLNVTARTSSFALKGQNTDIRETAKKLGVNSILEGSVRRAGDKVRVTAQLINSSDGFHIFSEVYDRDIKDIFAIQDEISLKIANRFREKLNTPPVETSAEAFSNETLDAYDLYLKGMYHLNKASFEGSRDAIQYFQEAINMAPNFALPYTGLSLVYSHFSAYKTGDPENDYQSAKEYATIAMELDNNLIESNLALAHVAFINEWNFKKTRELVNKAMKISPGNAEVHGWASVLANVEGNASEALVEARIAEGLDPLSPVISLVMGEALYTNKKFTEAIEAFDKTLEKLPDNPEAYFLKGRCLLTIGALDDALNLFHRMPCKNHKYSVHWGAVAYIYFLKKDHEKVLECFEKIQEEEKKGVNPFLNWSYAIVHLAMNDLDTMYYYLEKCLQEKSVALLFIKVDPIFEPFHGDPRFDALVEKYFNV